MRPERTFRAELQRLRRIARSEGLDPYAPAAPWVSVVERYRRRKAPRMTGAQIARAWEQAVASSPEPVSLLARCLSKS